MSDFHELQEDLKHVIKWSKCNNRTLHEDNFEYICHREVLFNILFNLHFTSMCFEYQISSGISLPPKSHLRYLSALMSDDLSWSKHIGTYVTRLAKLLLGCPGAFLTRRKYFSPYTSLLFDANCHVEYCSPLWNSSNKADM